MNASIATIQAAAPEPRRGHLRCPVCHIEHVAPIALDSISLAGQRGTLCVDRDGVRLNPTASPVEGGSAIGITFRCRQGHLFVLRLRSIYGSTTAETIVLPFPLTAQDVEQAWCRTGQHTVVSLVWAGASCGQEPSGLLLQADMRLQKRDRRKN